MHTPQKISKLLVTSAYSLESSAIDIYTILDLSISGSVNSQNCIFWLDNFNNSHLARNVIFGPNNMRFQNYVDHQFDALIASNFILSGPAKWSHLAHRSGALYCGE